MKIFLASAHLPEIRAGITAGLIDGVLVTPAVLTAAGIADDGHDLIEEICRETACSVIASIPAVDPEDIYREGREMARISDQVIVEVPFVEDAIPSIRRLSSEGVTVSAAFIFTPAQALLAAKAGATMIRVSLDSLASSGDSAVDVVAAIGAVFSADDVECDLIATFPRDPAEFGDCALAGADGVCLSQDVLRSLLVHPLTDRGVDQFLHEVSKRPKVKIAP